MIEYVNEGARHLPGVVVATLTAVFGRGWLVRISLLDVSAAAGAIPPHRRLKPALIMMLIGDGFDIFVESRSSSYSRILSSYKQEY